MNAQLPIHSLITEEEAVWLRGEMLRRAASNYEQISLYREAAECWSDLGECERAGVLYARGGDSGQAACLWLQAGRYHEALEAYRQWEQQLLKNNPMGLVQIPALLGQAACHLLGAREADQEFSEVAGRQAYQQARALLASIQGPTFQIALYWEALGDYGGWMGRYDLVQEGYEQALATLGSRGERMQLIRICRSYLAQARLRSDHLLCRQLEERLAARPPEEETSYFAPLPVTLSDYTGGTVAMAISPDKRKLFSGGRDHGIQVWDLSTRKKLHTLTGHTDHVLCVAISRDGRTLVSGSGDKTIKVWDLFTGREVRTLRIPGETGYWEIAIGLDGRILVSRSHGVIKVWDLSTGNLMRTFTGHEGVVYCMTISPDGRTLIGGSGGGVIKMWDLFTGREVRTLTVPMGMILCVMISPDGRVLFCGGPDRTIKILDLSMGELVRTLTGHTGPVTSIAVSLDGQMLASGSGDNTIRVWEGRNLRKGAGMTGQWQW